MGLFSLNVLSFGIPNWKKYIISNLNMKGNKTKKYKQGTNTKVKNIFWGKMDI
jgi:hypothetical protein